MAGRGLNGLRGIIVCYNPHNSRYTLELEAGDMMCLRSRNVRAVRFESGDVESGDGDGCPTALSVDGEASDPSVAVEDASVSCEDANHDTSGKVKSSSFKLSNVFRQPSFCKAWELALFSIILLWYLEVEVYGIVSIGLVIFFVWKFGTKDSTQAFSFDNVKTSLARLSIWEVWLVANILERGLIHVTRRR